MRNETFDALANEHRRALLVALSKNDSQDVSEHASVSEGRSGPISDQRARIEMHHLHLPKLEDYGFVRWDEGTGEVTRGPQFEEIRPLLECVANLVEGEAGPPQY
jgi:hypothetical protein